VNAVINAAQVTLISEADQDPRQTQRAALDAQEKEAAKDSSLGATKNSSTRQVEGNVKSTPVIHDAGSRYEDLDADGDGEITAEELFSQVDTDRSGHISLEEFSFLHSKIVKGAQETALKQAAAQRKIEQGEQRAKFLKAAVTVLLIGLVLMLAGNAALTAAVVFLSKETAVDDSGVMTTTGTNVAVRIKSGDFNVVGPKPSSTSVEDDAAPQGPAVAAVGGAILQVGQARVDAPLFVLPAMSVDQLMRIGSLAFNITNPPIGGSASSAGSSVGRRLSEGASHSEGAIGDEVSTAEEVIVVASVRKHSATSLTMNALRPGVTVTIINGVATYHDESDPSAPYHSKLCVAKVSCAAVSVRASEAEDLTRTALTALLDAGLDPDPGMRAYWTGELGLPWEALSNQTESRRQLSHRAASCDRLTDKRKAWCEAGWTRMKGSLDEKLIASGWGEEWNVFYAYGSIIIATDWWTKDGVPIPLKASWKWYTESVSADAHSCLIGFPEYNMFVENWTDVNGVMKHSPSQRAMYGVNPVCAQRQRNNLMDAAGQCITQAMGSSKCKKNERKYQNTDPPLPPIVCYQCKECATADQCRGCKGCADCPAGMSCPDCDTSPCKDLLEDLTSQGKSSFHSGYTFYAHDTDHWECDADADYEVVTQVRNTMPNWRGNSDAYGAATASKGRKGTYRHCIGAGANGVIGQGARGPGGFECGWNCPGGSSGCRDDLVVLIYEYFKYKGAGTDSCATELQAQKDMASGTRMTDRNCRAHDAYGGNTFFKVPSGWSAYTSTTHKEAWKGCGACRLHQDAKGSYFASEPNDKQGDWAHCSKDVCSTVPSNYLTTFWDGTSEADLGFSHKYGVELPAFSGFGYEDGQGTAYQRASACKVLPDDKKAQCLEAAMQFQQNEECVAVDLALSTYRAVTPNGEAAGWECVDSIASEGYVKMADRGSSPSPPPSPPPADISALCQAACAAKDACSNGDLVTTGCQVGSCRQACTLVNAPGTPFFGHPELVNSSFCPVNGCGVNDAGYGGDQFSKCGLSNHGNGAGVATTTCTNGNCNDLSECYVGASLTVLTGRRLDVGESALSPASDEFEDEFAEAVPNRRRLTHGCVNVRCRVLKGPPM
jgi:hypothetical protein